MKFKFLIVLVLISCCFFLTSCRSLRQENQKVFSQKEIKAEKIVKVIDTVLIAPSAETTIKIATEQLSTTGQSKVYTQKNAQAIIRVKIKHDTIYATARCDSLAMVAKIKESIIKEHYLNTNKTDKKTKRRWSWDFVSLIGFTVLLVTIPLVFKYLKK